MPSSTKPSGNSIEDSLSNLPYGLDGAHYRWVDLDGEGLSGILTEQGESWFYKANLSPANQVTNDGVTSTQPQFGGVKLVARQPSLAALDRWPSAVHRSVRRRPPGSGRIRRPDTRLFRANQR